MAGRTFIALLRGINVGGHNKLPMAALREACAALGWKDVRTYVQSGNVVFRAAGKAASLEEALAQAITQDFGLQIPVIVRDAAQWQALVAANPFPVAAAATPNLVMLALAQDPLARGAEFVLRERAAAGERIERSDQALWIHYPSGSARSKLTPALLDRAAGSPVTTRNWRTVQALQAMLPPAR